MTEDQTKKRQRVTIDILSEDSSFHTVYQANELAKEQIQQLDYSIKELKSINYLLEAKYEAQKRYVEFSIAEKDDKIKELEQTISSLKTSAIMHNEKAQDLATTLNDLKNEHKLELNAAHQETEDVRNEMSKVTTAYQTELERLGSLETQNKLAKDDLENKVKELNQKIDILQTTISDNSNHLKEAQSREMNLLEEMNKLKSELLQAQANQANDDTLCLLKEDNKSLSRQLADLKEKNACLANELKNSNETCKDIEILRHERDSLASKVDHLQDMKETNIRLSEENAELKIERSSWAAYLEEYKTVNASTPKLIIERLAREAKKAKDVERIENIYRQMQERDEKLRDGLNDHIEELKQKLAESEQSCAAEKAANERLQDSIASLKKRITYLENQLALYDHEEQVVIDPAKYDAFKTKRINELQELLNERDSQIISKNEELAKMELKTVPPVQIANGPYTELTSGCKLTDFISQMVEKEKEYIKELQEREANIACLLMRCDAAEGLLKQLNTSLAVHKKLDFKDTPQDDASTADPPTESMDIATDNINTAVHTESLSTDGERIMYQLRDNPASRDYAIRKSHLERLEKENRELVESLNNGNTSDLAHIPQATLDALYAHVEELKNTISSKEKRIQRLITTWEAKVKENSAQIQRILGYNVVFRTDDFIHLESIFADPAEVSFIIGPKNNDPDSVILRMRGSKKDFYYSQWEDLYVSHIVRHENIPAFLAAAQNELFMSYKQQQQREAYQHPDTEDVSMSEGSEE